MRYVKGRSYEKTQHEHLAYPIIPPRFLLAESVSSKATVFWNQDGMTPKGDTALVS